VFLTELLLEENVLRGGFEDGAEAGLNAATSRKAKPATATIRSIAERKSPLSAKARQRMSADLACALDLM
jgi:hypothetical protein